MSKAEQIESLENGRGIQHLLDASLRIFQNPVCVFDTGYNLLADNKAECDDPLWQELISTGTFCQETLEFISSMYFAVLDADADKLAVMKNPKLEYDRLNVKLFNRNGIRVASLLMIGYNMPLEEEDSVALINLAEKIELEIIGDESFNIYGYKSHETIINNLLDGIFDDPKVYTAHIQILYDGFEDYLRLAVIDVGQNDIFQINELLESRYPSYKFAKYSDQIVVIMSSKLKSFDEAALLDESLLAEYNMFAGVSDCFENMYELRGYYDQATAELSGGIKANNGQRVFVYQPPEAQFTDVT